MNENLALLSYGCNLVKNLEQNLPNLGNHPDELVRSCEEVVRVFSSVRERLVSQAQATNISMAHMQQVQGIPDWMRSGTTASSASAATFDLLDGHESGRGVYHQEQLALHEHQSGLELAMHGYSGGDNVGMLKSVVGGGEAPTPTVVDATTSRASSSQRRRR